MPPKANMNARSAEGKPVNMSSKVGDEKTRKLTDFWVKRDGGSSQSPSQPSQSSSPVKSASSKPLSKTPLPFTVGPFSLDGAGLTPNKNFGSGSSPSKPEVSPRKYIVIEDDEDEEDEEVMEILKSASRKRPRDAAQESRAATTTGVSAHSGLLESSSAQFADLTSSPPKKKRATDALVSPNVVRSGKSNLVSGALSRYNGPVPTHRSKQSQSSDLSFRSGGSDDVELLLQVQGETPKTVSEPPTTDAQSPSSSSVSLPTNATTNAPSETLQEPTAEEKARSRIEEIKRMATMKQPVQPSTSAPKSGLDMDWDASDEEEDDIFEKAFALKKPVAAPVKKAPAAPARTPSSHHIPGPFSSPLSELTSDEELAIKKLPKRKAPTPAPTRTTRASSKAPELPPPKAPSKGPPKKKATTQAPILAPALARPKPTMPSSLADLLSEKPKANKGKDAMNTRLLQEVEEDMKEINRRRVFGDSDEEDAGGDTMMVDPSVTEMALGEDDARKMNDVFASDRLAAVSHSPWRPFWNEQLVGAREATMQTDYKIPPLFVVEDQPVLSMLERTITGNDTSRLSTLLSSGIIYTIPPSDFPPQLAIWLFTLACSSETPSEVALLAELSLSNLFSIFSSNDRTTCPITFQHIITAISSLGPFAEALTCITEAPVTVSPPHDPLTRNLAVTALTRILRSVVKATLSLPEPENVMLLLLLIYLDPSTSAELRRYISLTIEDILISVTSIEEEPIKELDVCKRVVATTTAFRLVEKKGLLDAIFGGQPGPRRFMRWLACGLLLPETVQGLDQVTFSKPPPLAPFAEMLDLSRNPGSPYRIWVKTDYEDLLHNVEILGKLMTDVRIYSQLQDGHIDRILSGLDNVHSRIADARAAFLDRTRAKDALQRLRLRVYFQYKNTGQTTLDKMLK